ncbi:MAG: hypothetical protein J6D57_09250 [Mogibacterium sp.]|nr:hypothetical protein [Mogibacterium sp.]MBP3897994.1 hypothetical protein [Mogibacterium sp.]
MQIWQTRLPNSQGTLPEKFLHISFSHYILILSKVKNTEERIFYIEHAASEKLSLEELKKSTARR